MRNFEEYGHDIDVNLCEKSKVTYDFMSKYLDIIPFDGYINNENIFQVCAYDGDEMVGVRMFRMKDKKIHLNYAVVSESHRNLGVNKKMADKIIEMSKDSGVSIITSNVREGNKYSIKSLLSSGFQINDKVERYYDDGEKKISFFKKFKTKTFESFFSR